MESGCENNFRNVRILTVPAVSDLSIGVDWDNSEGSEFDASLKSAWLRKTEEGRFRYPLKITDTKVLPGKYEFLAQLNIERATNRRQPEEFQSVNEPFNHEKFNFMKIKEDEMIFRLDDGQNKNDYLAINVSPLEMGHSLLLPSLNDCSPQILTFTSLELAVALILMSRTPAFRIGFNSLCAYATVNHLHLHAYYLDRPMLLEHIKVEHLIGNCYLLLDYPGKGYVFQILTVDEIPAVLRDVFALTNYFVCKNVAHNLYFTRGVRFGASGVSRTCLRDSLRIYVWPRTSSTGVKALDAFNPATCELFGHLVIKNKEAYAAVTEESVAEVLKEITSAPFQSTKEEVTKLYC